MRKLRHRAYRAETIAHSSTPGGQAKTWSSTCIGRNAKTPGHQMAIIAAYSIAISNDGSGRLGAANAGGLSRVSTAAGRPACRIGQRRTQCSAHRSRASDV